MAAHAVADTLRSVQSPSDSDRRQVTAKHIPVGEGRGVAAAMAALLDGDHMAVWQVADHLIPDPAMKAGGMHQQQRGLLATKLGPPLPTRQRDAVDRQPVQRG